MTLPGAQAFVEGDVTRLAQIVSNLLNNAAKYTPDGGDIRLSGTVEAGWAVITVSDNGVGISPSVLPSIFDMFSQVDRTLTRAKGGLGIGLSLARRLVDMHGGTIEAKSAGIGSGSTFTVRLPLASAEVRDRARASEQAGPSAAARRILVVDDNVDGAETLVMLLELEGHEATMVHDGVAALDALRAARPDTVFLDIGLPGIDGYEVARRIRGDASLAQPVLIALTG